MKSMGVAYQQLSGWARAFLPGCAKTILIGAGLLLAGEETKAGTVSGSGTTCTISLDAGEELMFRQVGTTYIMILQQAGGGTWTSTATGTSITDATLTMSAAGLSAYNLFRIVDNGAGVVVRIGDGYETASVFNDAIEVELDAGAGLTMFDGNINFTSSFGISVVTDGPILVNSSQFKTVDGNISFSANMQATPRTFENHGTSIIGSTIEVTGNGTLLVKGKSGSSNESYNGVNLGWQSSLIGGPTGTTIIEGIGVIYTTSAKYIVGVQIADGTITTSGSNMSVRGSVINQATSTGVLVGVAFGGGGSISAGGSGSVSVTGVGGAGSNNCYGIHVEGGTITSNGGAVTVNGTGGGSGSSTGNHGIHVYHIETEVRSRIMAGGSGTVTITGVGGATNGNNNYGVSVQTTGESISSSGGNVIINGTGGGLGASGGNHGVYLFRNANITAVGSGTLSVNGTAGSSTGAASHGVFLAGNDVNGNCELASEGGDITITGVGGTASASGSHGVFLETYASGNTRIYAGSGGKINITGTGGGGAGNSNHGVALSGNSASLTAVDGDIVITGTSGGTSTSGSNYGVSIENGADITTGGTGILTIAGTAGNTSGNNNIGVYLWVASGTSSIQTNNGNISINGTGGGSGASVNNYGIHSNGGAIVAGGNGTITLTGNGGNRTGTGAASANNHGIYLLQNTGFTTNNGNISVTGYGGGATGTTSTLAGLNTGVFVGNGSYFNAGGSGFTTVLGEGGSNSTGSSGSSNYGVYITGQNTYITAANGPVTVTGIAGGNGGSGGNNHGVYMLYGSSGSSANGNIKSGSSSHPVTITGTAGSSSGNENVGVKVEGNPMIITSGGGPVSVTGNGGGAINSTNNYGVHVRNFGTITAGGSAAVTVIGTAGAANGGGCHGIYVEGGGSITTNPTTGGDLTVTGTAATSTTQINHGIFLTGTSTKFSTGAGNILVTGTGGGSNNAATNYGVTLQAGAQINAGGSGTVTVNGTSGNTNGNNNTGILVTGNPSLISSAGGNITLTGTGRGAGASANSHGVSVETNGSISAGGAGTVTITGTGGAGTGNTNYGVQASAGPNSIISAGGNVTITGTGGGTGISTTNHGVFVTGGTISAGGSGTVTVTGNGGNMTSVGATTTGNHGVSMASTGKIISAGGDISITGNGGGGAGSVATASTSNMGVYLAGGSYILAGGTGNTTVLGNGGANSTAGTGGLNHGVVVNGAASYISAADGEVTVTGNGGGDGGSGAGNYGVMVQHASGTSAIGNIKSGSSTKAVTVTGTGGESSGNDNYGVRVEGNAAAIITSGGGPVTVTGTGGGLGSSITNFGVSVSAGIITSGGTGTVTIVGEGGNRTGAGAASAYNFGVLVRSAGKITSAGGNVSVTGNGGGPSGTVAGAANLNHGVCLLNSTSIAAGGTGSTTVTGKGGANSTAATGGDNYGIYIAAVTSQELTTQTANRPFIGAANGPVSVTGNGGGDGGSGDKNYGIFLNTGGYITSTTSGQPVTVTGTGGTGTGGSNFGIYMKGGTTTGFISQITSTGGAVTVTGTGGNVGSTGQTGILMQAYSTINSTGSGAVTVNAIAGSSSGSGISRGLVMETATALMNSNGGDVTINATEGSTSNSVAMSVDASKIDMNTTNGGNLFIYTNSLKWVNNGVFNTKTNFGTSIAPKTAGKQIEFLSTATDPYDGPLHFTQSRLRVITGPYLAIGDENTGTMTISATMDLSTPSPGVDIYLATATNAGVSPTATGSDFVMASSKKLTLSAPLNIQINGTTVNNETTGYRQLRVTGTSSTVALSDASLVLSGDYTPVTGDVFTIVSAIALTGTFNDQADGSTISYKGKTLRVNYTATSVTLTCINNAITWNGSVSSSWTDPLNWTPNVVPTSTDEVVIPTVTSPAVPPQLAATTTTNNLTIDAGSTLEIPSSTTLNVSGNLTVNGTSSGDGVLSMSGTSAQQISGAGTLKQLTINNTSGVSITSGAGNELKITGTLTPTAGVLTTNGNLRLVSTASGTARIASHDNGASISGNVIVERYLEGSSRPNQWRLFGFPYSTGVALSSITGLGIDVTTNKSVMIFNEGSDDAAATGRNAGYQQFSSLSDIIPAYRGFSAWVFGGSGSTAGAGTLSAALTVASTGNLNESGNSVSIPVTYSAGKGWNLVANPYASSIDWSVVAGTASNITNVGATVYRWNPVAQAWNYHNGTAGTGMDNIIESGAGFFVRTTGASPALTIPQAAKVATNSNTTNLFRKAPFRLDIPGQSIRNAVQESFGIRMWAAGMGNPAPDEVYLDLSRSDATPGFDARYDAHNMGRTAGVGLALTDSTGTNYAMQFDAPIRDDARAKRYYALTLTTPVVGETSIKLAREGNWDKACNISLIDLVDHRTIVMTGDTLEYNFRMDQKKISGRFLVALNHVPVAAPGQLKIQTLGNPVSTSTIDLLIDHPEARPRRWMVTSINGARVGEGVFGGVDGNVQHRLNVPGMQQAGVYLLNLEMDNGERQTIRIVRK